MVSNFLQKEKVDIHVEGNIKLTPFLFHWIGDAHIETELITYTYKLPYIYIRYFCCLSFIQNLQCMS